jgi:hypothetical protein
MSKKETKLANSLPDPAKINWDEFREKLEKEKEWSKKLGEWENRHGWKDHRRGTCRLCGSKVRPDESKEIDPQYPVLVGGRSHTHIIRNGFYCTNKECGIMYKTCPPPITQEYDVPRPVRETEE